MKTCTKCGEKKSVEEFYLTSKVKGTRSPRCKACLSDYQRKYQQENKKKVAERNRKYQQENKEKLKEKRRKRIQENKENFSERARKYRQENKEARRKYYHENKEKAAESMRKYHQKNKERYAERTRNRYHTDPEFKMQCIVRVATRRVFAGKAKDQTTQELISCSFEFFKAHIEKQFTDGMNWDNQGEWHFDHIMPLDSFDLSDPEERRKACHYSNFQPLWAADNIAKGATVPDEVYVPLEMMI